MFLLIMLFAACNNNEIETQQIEENNFSSLIFDASYAVSSAGYPECEETNGYILRQAHINRAAQLLAMARGIDFIEPKSYELFDEAEQIMMQIGNRCSRWTDEIYVLGLFESGYSQRYLQGDHREYIRRHHLVHHECPDGWIDNGHGCFSPYRCETDINIECVPTSCGYWQIRTIFENRPSCNQLVDNTEISIDFVCDWLDDNYPNIAAYNAGNAGAREGRGQAYSNRVFIALELLRGRANMTHWRYNSDSGQRRNFVHEYN